MVAGGGKKSKMAERGEEQNSDPVDPELVLTLEKIQELQDELQKVNEEASEKISNVEKKFNVIRRPVYQRRHEIIQSIPHFWLTAILSHPKISDLLNEDDQKIFKHFISLDVEDCRDAKAGYSITFNFAPNPYFEETKLTKTFAFLDDGRARVTATEINWKEGMAMVNDDANENKGTKRPFSDDSFFSWFLETDVKSFTDGIPDEVSDMIKGDLWPNPLKYFNQVADEEYLDGEDADEEEMGTEDDDDEEDEDEQDEEDDS